MIYQMQIDPLYDNLQENAEFQEIVSNQLLKNKNIREEIARLEAAGELWMKKASGAWFKNLIVIV